MRGCLVRGIRGFALLSLISSSALGCHASRDAPASSDAGATPPNCTVERCNDLDDDCDGRIDEALAGGDLCVRVPATLSVSPRGICATTSSSFDFTEEASSRGVDFVAPWIDGPVDDQRDRHVGAGVIVSDLTGDGAADLLLTAPWGRNALYLNDGTGQFTLHPNSGIEDIGRTIAASAVDRDGDGLKEVYLSTWDAVHAFDNLGGGQFVEVPLLWDTLPMERASFIAWTDFDGDGHLDAYIGVGGSCFTDKTEPCLAHDVLLRGESGGSFIDASEGLGGLYDRRGLALAGSWFDADGDGDLDAYVANDGGSWHTSNRLFLNPGSPHGGEEFVEAGRELGLDAEIAGMGIAFGDVDLDGAMSVVISDVRRIRHFEEIEPSHYDQTVVGINAVPPSMNRVAAAWAVELVDLDLDADLDLVSAWHWLYPVSWWSAGAPEDVLLSAGPPLRPRIFERKDGEFEERVPVLDGLPDSWMWHTASPVDLNHDGAIDLVFTSIMGPVGIQMGKCLDDAHFLEIRLDQATHAGNRDALGARVEITTPRGTQWRLIGVGSTGSQSAHEPVAHFGLADATEAELLVRWPDGRVSEMGLVNADQRLRVVRQPEP